ncbi:MAG: hypothetical protein ACFFBD_28960 [Candidatus Hodarchaeota archaeon]
MNNCCYFQIAGITIRVDSALPFAEDTFQPNLRLFQVTNPGKDTISIQHHFFLPKLDYQNLGQGIHHGERYIVHKKGDSWIHLVFEPEEPSKLIQVAIFNHDYTKTTIYNSSEESFRRGNLSTLTFLIKDEILLAHVLADRQGCYFHASGVRIENKGFLFLGKSGAGKSTIARMLKQSAEILCDERLVVRKVGERFKMYGAWTNQVRKYMSVKSAPLNAIMFLEQAQDNQLIPLKDRKEIMYKLLPRLIRPFRTAYWWNKTFSFLENLIQGVPCYVLKFDKSGEVVNLLKQQLI